MYNFVDVASFIHGDGIVDWTRLVGSTLTFEYNEKIGELYISDYIKNRSVLEAVYLDTYYYIDVDAFFSADLGAITPLNFKYAVKDEIETVLQTFVVDEVLDNQGITYNCRCTSCKCISNLTEQELFAKTPCKYCRGFKMLEGESDLGITHPEVAALLLDKQLAREVTKKTPLYTGWLCPTCGLEIFNKQIKSVAQNGLSCIYCAPSYSFGAKFIFACLWQLDLDVAYEYSPTWARGKRYDLYVASDKLIVEVHGMHHYQDVYTSTSHEVTVISDTFKREIALGNDINNYIELDCRYSEHEWLEKQVRRSSLASLYDLSKVDFRLCLLFALGKVGERICHLWENGLSIAEITREVQEKRSYVRTAMVRGAAISLCSYTAEMGTQRGQDTQKKKVVLMTTGETFMGLNEVAKLFKLNSNTLARTCAVGGYLGHDKRTGIQYQWGYEADYLSGVHIVARKYHDALRSVVCLDTGKLFHNVMEASDAYNIPNYLHILDVCEGHRSYAGKHPIKKVRLSWMYLEDYESLLLEEQHTSGLFEDD